MNISSTERILFEKLRKEREQDFKVFSKRDYKGIWTGIIDKYPESAHFIYELLQNADDVEATYVRIILCKDRLYFLHNGKIGFSITDVDSEEQGHINAITAVGNSTKTDSENKIGKFGVGFKAVFQYTKTPEIIEDKFKFRIINYIIPEELQYDHPLRKDGETLFVFPFFNPNSAYNDIKERLSSLDNPILFLRHLKHIEWTNEVEKSGIHIYDKHVSLISMNDETKCERIISTDQNGTNEILMFSKMLNLEEYGEHEISLGYYLNDEKKIDTTIRPRIFCFFPTSQKFNMCFVCHAPFLLVDSRQQIKENAPINKLLIECLAELAGTSLIMLRDISLKDKKVFLDDNIFDIVPLKKSHPSWQTPQLTDNDLFFDAYKETIENNDVLYSKGKKYISVLESVICTPVSIQGLFTSKQLSDYYSRQDLSIDFLSQEICVRANREKDLMEYFTDILEGDHIDAKDIANRLDVEFLNAQDESWILKLYTFLRNDAIKQWKFTKNNTNEVKDLPFLTCPIIKTKEGTWVAPYQENGALNVFLPIEGQAKANYNVVADFIMKDKIGAQFMEELGLKKPDELEFIKNIILPKYENCKRGSLTNTEISNDFETIYNFAETTSAVTRKDLIALLKSKYSVICSFNHSLSRITNLYDPVEDNLHFIATKEGYTCETQLRYEEERIKNITRQKEKDKNERRSEWDDGVDDGSIDPDDEPYDEWYENNYGYEFNDEMEEGESRFSNFHYAYDTISFIDLSYYQSSIIKHGRESVMSFFYELGLRNRLCWVETTNNNKYNLSREQRAEISDKYCTDHKVVDYIIFGLDRYFNYNSGCPKHIGLWIWNTLCQMDLDAISKGLYKWKYYSWYKDEFTASWIILLQQSRWLLGEYTPAEVTQEDLLEAGYAYNENLYRLLNIRKQGKSMQELGASKEQISNEALGKKMKSLGFNEEDIDEFIQWKRSRKQSSPSKEYETSNESKSNNSGSYEDTSKGLKEDKKNKSCNRNETEQHDDDYEIEPDTNAFPFTGREELSKPALNTMFQNNNRHSNTISQPSSKTTSEKVEELNERMKEDERREKEIIDLQEQADKLPKYSVEWFKTLLELEYQGSSKEFVNKDKKALSISFSCVLQEADSDRIYILKNPSRNIPLWLEEVGGISVVFLFNNREEVKFNFEVGNVRDYTLRLKAKTIDAPDLAKIDWAKCTRATINVNNPIELVGSLKDAFNELPFKEGYNLKSGLSSIKDLNFVFGPPGTGKTTWLSNKITSIINESKECKILVLAPTNKACDVLARKMLDINPDDYSWIYRFVASGDEYLEDMDIVADRESDIHMMDKLCLVSTMARLPFDGFRGDYCQRLMDIDWGYVICDEASMIPLVQMMLVVYRFKQSKIFIAGDPMQIGPIVREPRWQDENIYTMIKLNKFDNPKTEPIQFKIDNLPKQYRSLPAIGELFSQYAYNGKLIHHRSLLKYKKPYLGEIDFNQINFISFKVEKYDSIFGAKKLDGSNVHIYSALLTVETCLYVAKSYASKEKEEVYNIGIICPYAPQAQLVERLIEQQEGLPINVNISVGTIHSFQGDECDMIFALMNPPTGMKGAADKIFLNRQNIINVAISRAKNILCVVMPHCNTDGYENLFELNRLGYIASQIKNSVNLFTCDEIEEIIFGKKFYLENNTFVTSHQLANVYTKPVKRYEVRIDESSIDIQIGKTK